jgi:hypothetical protein
VRVLRHPTYRLHVSFRTRDDVAGNPVEYRVLPTSGSYALPFAEGATRAQRVSTSLAIQARRPDLPIVVEIRAADPLGNDAGSCGPCRFPADLGKGDQHRYLERPR